MTAERLKVPNIFSIVASKTSTELAAAAAIVNRYAAAKYLSPSALNTADGRREIDSLQRSSALRASRRHFFDRYFGCAANGTPSERRAVRDVLRIKYSRAVIVLPV